MSQDIAPKAPVFQGGKGLFTGGLLAAALGLGLFAVGWATEPKQALFSYLTAFAYGLSIALGALLFLMIGYVMRASWPVTIRRLTESIAGTLPLFLLLFVPIALGLSVLYLWVDPHGVEGHLHHLLEHKKPYLSLPSFLGRAALYFLIWSVLSFSLRRASLRQDKEPGKESNAMTLSAVGIPLTALALTFAAFDWLMSLSPEWFSAIFGVYYFAGGFLAMIALLIILTFQAERAGYLAGFLRKDHYHALGRLLLAFVVFWTYCAYSQGFLIYIANKPEETPWYIVRSQGGWEPIGLVLIIGHFALPFLTLLSRSLKFRPALLSLVAAWLLVMHYVDLHWVVMPTLHPEAFSPHWLDVAALVGVLGAMLALGTYLLRGHPIVPQNDPALEKGRSYHSL